MPHIGIVVVTRGATKGSIFELLYRRFVVRLGHAQAIGAIAHRLCRLVWKILHDGSRTRNAARPSSKRAYNVEPPRWSENSAVSATANPNLLLRAAGHDRGRFSTRSRGQPELMQQVMHRSIPCQNQ